MEGRMNKISLSIPAPIRMRRFAGSQTIVWSVPGMAGFELTK
jgi:hypothetical protein